MATDEKDTPSTRMEIYNEIEANRTAQVNAELEESGSKERLEHEPTPEIKKPSGKDAPDEDQGDGEDSDGDTGGDAGQAGDDGKDKESGGRATGQEETIYDFLDEAKLDKTVVTVKVDGVEQKVKVADLIRDAQFDGAARARLNHAVNVQREAERVLAEANAEAERVKKAGNKDQAGADTGDGQDNGTPSGKDAIQKAGELLYSGDYDGFATTLDQEIERRAQERNAATGKSPTIDDIKAEIKTDLTWDAAIAKFNTDHPEIASDPELARMMQRHLNEAAQTESTPQGAIDIAVKSVTGWLTKVSGKSGDGEGERKAGLRVDDQAIRQRKEDKARSDSVRSTTSIRSQSRTEPEEEYNPSKVVEEMKRARGQL